jgi:hypothetical protein
MWVEEFSWTPDWIPGQARNDDLGWRLGFFSIFERRPIRPPASKEKVNLDPGSKTARVTKR